MRQRGSSYLRVALGEQFLHHELVEIATARFGDFHEESAQFHLFAFRRGDGARSQQFLLVMDGHALDDDARC